MSVSEAASKGRLAGLVALRDRLAMELDSCDSARDVAALSRQFTDVLAQIEELDSSADESAPATPLEGLMKKLAERQARSG